MEIKTLQIKASIASKGVVDAPMRASVVKLLFSFYICCPLFTNSASPNSLHVSTGMCATRLHERGGKVLRSRFAGAGFNGI
jgi:hypothetical protein